MAQVIVARIVLLNSVKVTGIGNLSLIFSTSQLLIALLANPGPESHSNHCPSAVLHAQSRGHTLTTAYIVASSPHGTKTRGHILKATLVLFSTPKPGVTH